MKNLIKKYKIISNDKFNNIEELYNFTKSTENLDFTKYSENELILYLNNTNCKFLDTTTGKFVNKLPDEIYSKEILIKMCESHNKKLIEKLIIKTLKEIANLINKGKENDLINKILKETSFSNNEKIRLECASVSPNFIYFLNDRNKDISKIANIKLNYSYDISNFSNEEIKLINFLEKYIKSNQIEFIQCPVTINYDSKKRIIKSYIFNEEEITIDYIITKISDKKIIANKLYDMILEDKLTFKKEFEPVYLEEILRHNNCSKYVYCKIDKTM